MASHRLPGPGRPRASLAFALVGPCIAALAACDAGVDGTELDAPRETTSCSARGCASGVRIAVPDFSAPEFGPGPLAFRVCFDDSCTDLALRGDACEIVGVRPLDQSTYCYASRSGPLFVEIARVDGRPYAGKRPVVALSARDADGALLFQGAAEVPLEPVYANGPACGITCAQGEIAFQAGPPRGQTGQAIGGENAAP